MLEVQMGGGGVIPYLGVYTPLGCVYKSMIRSITKWLLFLSTNHIVMFNVEDYKLQLQNAKMLEGSVAPKIAVTIAMKNNIVSRHQPRYLFCFSFHETFSFSTGRDFHLPVTIIGRMQAFFIVCITAGVSTLRRFSITRNPRNSKSDSMSSLKRTRCTLKIITILH